MGGAVTSTGSGDPYTFDLEFDGEVDGVHPSFHLHRFLQYTVASGRVFGQKEYVALFPRSLTGFAVEWYCNLDDEIKLNWTKLCKAFTTFYMHKNGWNPTSKYNPQTGKPMAINIITSKSTTAKSHTVNVAGPAPAPAPVPVPVPAVTAAASVSVAVPVSSSGSGSTTSMPAPAPKAMSAKKSLTTRLAMVKAASVEMAAKPGKVATGMNTKGERFIDVQPIRRT